MYALLPLEWTSLLPSEHGRTCPVATPHATADPRRRLKRIQRRYTYAIRIGAEPMTKKLTITVDDDVYEGLYSRVGRRRISRFLNDLARPHVSEQDLEAGYKAMAADEERERDALEWSEGLIGDIADDRR
jgi:predicted CopG family antitoxin